MLLSNQNLLSKKVMKFMLMSNKKNTTQKKSNEIDAHE